MNFWWLTNFARVGKEKRAVEQLAATSGWFTLTQWRINAYRLSADGVIRAHDVDYPVRLIYPDLFPAVPAWVEPQDAAARWSDHQYGAGGTLCLELRPDNWTAAATGADVLQSAYNLLLAENPLGEGDHASVPSGHDVGEVQAYGWGSEPVLIRAGCLERLRHGGAEGLKALRWQADGDVWPILVSDAADRAAGQDPPGFDLGTLRLEIAVALSSAAAPAATPPARADLATTLGLILDPAMAERAMVFIAAGGDAPVVYHSTTAEKVFRRKWVVLPDQAGVRSGRPTAAAAKRVAVVGLGSVGGKVAEILLRAGIHRQLLVDGDVMLPDNLERHTLDWRDVGFRKVVGVKQRLLHVAPRADILTIAANLDWQRSAKTHADQLDAIAACDLIVDATGSATASLFLGAVAAEIGRPFLSVEAYEGGLGCLVARSLPGRDPPYLAGRIAYHAYCEQRDVTPPPSGRGRYEVIGEADEPIVADDAAITAAAGHAARVALDILDETVGTAETAWLIIGFKAGWLFGRHGETIGLDIGPAAPSEPPPRDRDAEAFALALTREALDAADDTP